jgi:hypothetical protein
MASQVPPSRIGGVQYQVICYNLSEMCNNTAMKDMTMNTFTFAVSCFYVNLHCKAQSNTM